MDKRHCVTADLNPSWFKTEDAIELVRPGYGVTGYVPVPTADVCQPLSFGQLALALLKRLLRLLALSDVSRNPENVDYRAVEINFRKQTNTEVSAARRHCPSQFIVEGFSGVEDIGDSLADLRQFVLFNF